MSGKRTQRRRHYKVEELSCRETVDRMLAAGHTYDEIVQAVREAGEEIGKSSVQRYHSSWEQVAEKLRKTREQVKVLVQAVRESPNTDLAEVANNLLLYGLTERIAQADNEWAELSLEKAGRLAANLERSMVARERLKLQFHQGVQVAIGIVKEQLRAALADRPDLAEQLAQVVDEAAGKAKAQVTT